MSLARALATPRPAQLSQVRLAGRRRLVGIVGGLGPLASAELLSTVYRLRPPSVEQDAPRVLLWSDPDVVDRTEAIESDQLDLLHAALERSIGGLLTAGAERIVVACMTAHRVFDRLPADMAGHCVSLVDAVLDQLERDRRPYLLLCTRGSAIAGLFTRPALTRGLARQLVPLDDADQELLHQYIYRLKGGEDPRATLALLRDELLPRYGTPGFIAGCTELHLVTRLISGPGLAEYMPHIDPLALVAQSIVDGTI